MDERQRPSLEPCSTERAQALESKAQSGAALNAERVSIEWKNHHPQKCGVTSPMAWADGPATLIGIQSAFTYAASAVRR